MSSDDTAPLGTPAPEPPGAAPSPAGAPLGLTRRRFLTGLGAAGVIAAGGYSVVVWARDNGGGGGTAGGAATTRPRAATTPSSAVSGVAEGRTLVVLEFLGGNDSLNTVVPHADARYASLRPTLGVTDPIDLDGEIGLHPALKTLAGEYEAGRLAVVEGIGYPEPDLSHFASQAIWWTARREEPSGSGWLGRYLDAAVGYDDPLAGISVGAGPSPVLAGEASFSTSVADATGLQPRFPSNPRDRDLLLDAWAGFTAGADSAGDGGDGLLGAVRAAMGATVTARRELAATLGGDTAGAGNQEGAGRARPGELVAALMLAARLAGSDTPPRVVHVRAAGDFDTHQGQAQRQPTLMENLDAGIAAYLQTVDDLGASDRVVLMTASEFGRRAKENGTGTDHGTAAAHLVLGEAVSGGRYGEPLDLAGLDGTGNLVHTLDYRAYYASLLHGWLGADPEALLGAGYDPLPLFG